jgi:uncharacterized protein YjgD (DUF1641 family)
VIAHPAMASPPPAGAAAPDATMGLDVRLERIERSLAALTAAERRRADEREMVSDLVHDLGPVSHQGMAVATRLLDEAQRRGYIEFVRGGLGVVDRIVTSFDRDDVEALGENVVLILETVKEMTQPEVMTMLRRTAHLVSEQGPEPSEPPTLVGLLGQLRDRDVRRGLHRVLRVLRSVGQESTTKEARP